MEYSGTPSTYEVRDRLAALADSVPAADDRASGQAYAGGLLSYGPNVA
jgi:hypothetical protein